MYEDDFLEAAYEDQNGAPQGDEQDDQDYPEQYDDEEEE